MLTMNLPVAWDSSVFLHVDEAHIDVIKVLIRTLYAPLIS